jgi:hypothetical protein
MQIIVTFGDWGRGLGLEIDQRCEGCTLTETYLVDLPLPLHLLKLYRLLLIFCKSRAEINVIMLYNDLSHQPIVAEGKGRGSL